MKTADTRDSTPGSDQPPNGTIDQRRLMFYSADWQLVEERVDDTYSGGTFVEDRRVQYFWGLRGGSGGDDIVMRRQRPVPSGAYARFYHLTDTQFSTIVVISELAVELERISYDAYGRARHHPPGDLDGDGVVTSADAALWTSLRDRAVAWARSPTSIATAW